MEQARLSRRDFLRGAGLTGAAAAGMLAFPGAGKAFADDGAADAQSTEATGIPRLWVTMRRCAPCARLIFPVRAGRSRSRIVISPNLRSALPRSARFSSSAPASAG